MAADTSMAIFARGELLPFRGEYYLWSFVPSVAAAVIFIILFLICSVAHTWKMWQHRMWFCSVFVIGGYLEVIGYAGRAAASNATDKLGPYIIQSVFLLVPPSLFAASIYMTLGRIIRGLGPVAEQYSLIRVSRLTKFFVWGDVFAFLVQGNGAGIMAAGEDMGTIGKNVVIAGLVIQIMFFGFFVIAAIVFHRRFSAAGPTVEDGLSGNGLVESREFPWEGMMHMLYGTSALILTRCIFRIVEYIMGPEAYLLTHEWTLYVFDGVLMVAVMVIFYWWYPSEIGQPRRTQSSSGNVWMKFL